MPLPHTRPSEPSRAFHDSPSACHWRPSLWYNRNEAVELFQSDAVPTKHCEQFAGNSKAAADATPNNSGKNFIIISVQPIDAIRASFKRGRYSELAMPGQRRAHIADERGGAELHRNALGIVAEPECRILPELFILPQPERVAVDFP